MDAAAPLTRFVWTEGEFDAFVLAYEGKRREAGVGETLWRVSPGQRADAIMTISGLNAGAGWRRTDKENERSLWLRYLAPVLAETRESAAALRDTVNAGLLPGRFEPSFGGALVPSPASGPDSSKVSQGKTKNSTDQWRRPSLRDILLAARHILLRPQTGVVVGLVLAWALVGAAVTYIRSQDTIIAQPPCRVNCAQTTPPDGGNGATPPDATQPTDPVRAARLRFLDVTLAAAEQYGFSISPYTLAEYYAGESDFIAEPALFLQAMLKRWPLPPYEPIAPTREGAFALGQYSLAAAETDLAVGLDRAGLALGIDVATQATPDDAEGAQAKLYARIEAFRYEDLTRRAHRIIAEHLGVDGARVIDSAKLGPDLGADELDAVELVMAFEEDFGVEIPDGLVVAYVMNPKLSVGIDPVPDSTTVADMFALVAAALNQPVMQGSMQPVPERWPDWPRFLLFLPLLPAVIWAFLSGTREIRAGLVNPPHDRRFSPWPLASRELAQSAPQPQRRLARQLSWQAPVPSGRLDAKRSITNTLKREGFFQPVFGTRRRAAEFLFLIPARRERRQDTPTGPRPVRADHEVERVRRLIGALEAGGMTLSVYEYDPDPRTLFPARTRGREHQLDLRALQELHPQARLVLVTDGRELTDYFTGRAFPFVAERLRAWPARMLLTPVPMAEWGEREMNLSAALAAPVGRASARGFQDLAAGFGIRHLAGWEPPVLVSGGPLADVAERIDSWRRAAAGLVGATRSVPPRSRLLRDDDLLLSDIPPSADERKRLTSELSAWLGDDAFYWLAACAAYPQLRFPITVYLGHRLQGRRGLLYDEDRLAKLCLLPWFRQGRMPAWLRDDLLEQLDKIDERRRAAVDLVLARMLSSLHDVRAAGEAPTEIKDVAEGSLAVWLLDDAHGRKIAVDEVVPDLDPETMPKLAMTLKVRDSFADQLDRARNIVSLRLAAVAGVGLWCWALFRFWPQGSAAPHAPGAWLPLVAVAVVFVAGLFAVLVFRRLKSLGWWQTPEAAAELRLLPPPAAMPMDTGLAMRRKVSA